jgi:ketosteroid isomerase-like protein
MDLFEDTLILYDELLSKPNGDCIMMKKLACAAALALSAPLSFAATDSDVVRDLNTNYIRAWREHDMDWYRQHLADDFVCTAGDGKVLSKEDFVSFPNQGALIKDAHVEEIIVRVHGATATVTGNTVVEWKDGRHTATRYTDTYAKVGGEWKAVSAQLTADQHFKR